MAVLMSLSVYKVRGSVVELGTADDLRAFPWLYQGTIRSVIANEGNLVAWQLERGEIEPGKTACLTYEKKPLEDYVGYALRHRTSDLAAVLFARKEYPQRVACGLLSEAVRLFSDFESAAHSAELKRGLPDLFKSRLADLFHKFQKPEEADKLMKVQKDLDEVMHVVSMSMDELLTRGEKISELEEKSGKLARSAEVFKRMSARNNSWCAWLTGLFA